MYVMACPPVSSWLTNIFFSLLAADSNGMMGSMMQDLAFAIPGVDEAMSFAEIMKYVFVGCAAPWHSGTSVDERILLQTRQIDGILRYRLRYSSYRTYTSIPFFPHRVGKGARKTQFARVEVWSYD